MPPSTWPGIKQIQAFFGRTEESDESPTVTITLDVAEMGTAERVSQMKAIVREFQTRTVEAAEAYKSKLRGS